MNLVQRTVGVGAHTAASYLVVRYSAQAASRAADVAAFIGPKIAHCFSFLGSLGTRNNTSLFSFSINWSKILSDTGTKVVNSGHNFSALAKLSPIHGVAAGFGISLVAEASDWYLSTTDLFKDRTVTRCLLSHVAAGALVCGLSAVALKVGLVAAALTVTGAVTLTATALAVHAVTRFAFHCCAEPAQKSNEPEKKETLNLVLV